MADKGLLKVGIVGTIIAAICCFTPVLAVLLGSVGLSAAFGFLDYILLPALALFVGITLYSIMKTKRT
ncbi:MAG: mercury resistance system transport protein MerF [Gammaproteobacteria bacterium]|nr:mercury resistance system transport protein MerF [Gammaproteobacteria bacterium]